MQGSSPTCALAANLETILEHAYINTHKRRRRYEMRRDKNRYVLKTLLADDFYFAVTALGERQDSPGSGRRRTPASKNGDNRAGVRKSFVFAKRLVAASGVYYRAGGNACLLDFRNLSNYNLQIRKFSISKLLAFRFSEF